MQGNCTSFEATSCFKRGESSHLCCIHDHYQPNQHGDAIALFALPLFLTGSLTTCILRNVILT